MIPIAWKEYRCTMAGTVLKAVECESCKLVYVYQMSREVQGMSASLYFLDNQGAESRSRAEAEAALKNTLAGDCDPVPCLQCGHYQRHMVEKIRATRYAWLPWLAMIAPLAAAIFGGITWLVYDNRPSHDVPVALVVLTSLAAVAAVCLIRAQVVVARFDPNAAPVEERQALGRGRAVTLEEFQQLMKEQEAAKSQGLR